MPNPLIFSSDPSLQAFAQKVKDKFTAWRRSTSPGVRRIPDELWNNATELAGKSTVHRVSRFLGLDYVHLKNRVIAAFGQNCAALPGRFGNSSKSVDSSPLSRAAASVSSKVSPPECCHQSSAIPPAQIFPIGMSGSVEPLQEKVVETDSSMSSRSQNGSRSRLTDGFLEACSGIPQMWVAPPLLAEIQSLGGEILRLYSPDTDRIVRAFLQK
jgi:hypothetical protein